MPLHRGRARRRLPHWHVHGWFTGMLLALRSLLFSAGPRCLDGRYEPEGLLRGEVLDVPVVWRRPWRCHGSSSLRNRRSLSPTAENCGFSAVAVHQGRCLPVATPRLTPTVLAT